MTDSIRWPVTVHAILRPSGRTDTPIPGVALEVSEAELETADRYEPAEYRRTLARLGSGREAWVYVDAPCVGPR